jgi:hypothetical protein
MGKGKTCSYCGKPAEGNYSIHRDGFGQGPEVELCASCGCDEEPTTEDIWARIGQASACIKCDEEIRAGDERVGSFHSWCAPDSIAAQRRH